MSRSLILKAFRKWREDDGITYGAALSFYLIMSLPSLLLFSVSLGSIFLKEQRLQAIIVSYISTVADEEFILILNLLFERIPDINSLSFGVLISLLLLLWSAGNLFRQLKGMLDRMWGFSRKKRSWARGFVNRGIASIAAVFIFGGLLVLSIIVETALYISSKFLNIFLPFSPNIFRYTSSIASFLILVILFLYIYGVLPEASPNFKYVSSGSVMTVTLITLGKYLFGFYLSYGNITSVYGAIGSVLGVFLWIYFSSISITFMAEFTKVYSDSEN